MLSFLDLTGRGDLDSKRQRNMRVSMQAVFVSRISHSFWLPGWELGGGGALPSDSFRAVSRACNVPPARIFKRWLEELDIWKISGKDRLSLTVYLGTKLLSILGAGCLCCASVRRTHGKVVHTMPLVGESRKSSPGSYTKVLFCSVGMKGMNQRKQSSIR